MVSDSYTLSIVGIGIESGQDSACDTLTSMLYSMSASLNSSLNNSYAFLSLENAIIMLIQSHLPKFSVFLPSYSVNWILYLFDYSALSLFSKYYSNFLEHFPATLAFNKLIQNTFYFGSLIFHFQEIPFFILHSVFYWGLALLIFQPLLDFIFILFPIFSTFLNEFLLFFFSHPFSLSLYLSN